MAEGGPRIILSGYYGFGNCGDEAIAAGMVAALKRRLPGAELSVLSKDPGATAASLGVRAEPRWPFAEVRGALRGSSLLISGGGGLLQDATSGRSLRYYLTVIKDAMKAGAKTMVFAQGIGPIRRWGSRRAVRSVLNRVDGITVRDQRSRDFLDSAGVSVPPTRLAADAAFLLPEATSPVGGHAKNGTVCVCLRRSRGMGGALSELAAGLDASAKALSKRVVFLPLQAGDVEVSEGVARLMTEPADVLDHRDYLYALRAIEASDLVVGMRLHALVFAVMRCVPHVAVSYDPKVASFAEDIGIKGCLQVDGLRARDLESAILSAAERAGDIEGLLLGARSRLAERARLSVELAASLLGR